MPDSTLAGVITASASVLTAIGLVISALTLFIPILRETKESKKKVEEVHVIVNQQRTDTMRYQVALIKALQRAGVDVPDDQSVEESPKKD